MASGKRRPAKRKTTKPAKKSSPRAPAPSSRKPKKAKPKKASSGTVAELVANARKRRALSASRRSSDARQSGARSATRFSSASELAATPTLIADAQQSGDGSSSASGIAPTVATPELVASARQSGAQALSAARSSESLEAVFDAWLELRLAFQQLQRKAAQERERLDAQGSLLVGALRGSGDSPALAVRGELEKGVTERLERARAELEEQLGRATDAYRAALAELFTTAHERVARRAKLVKPKLRLTLQVLAGERRILHLARPGADDAVVLLFAFTGRLPTRYQYLFDDSTDDLNRAPPMLYPEEGVADDGVRPTPGELKSQLLAQKDVWPVKAMLPMLLEQPGQPPLLMRWLSRGPVLEAELEDGAGFRNVLSKVEAERVTSALLGLKLEGRIELELSAG